jgi:hypothetical protein
MKYVITRSGQVILGSNTYHADLMRAATEGDYLDGAGHCSINGLGKVEVTGGSLGYGIDSKPGDAYQIEQALGL